MWRTHAQAKATEEPVQAFARAREEDRREAEGAGSHREGRQVMSDAIVLADQKAKLQFALADWASALANITPEQRPAALEQAIMLKKLSEEVYERLRDTLLADVRATGETVTEKGSMQMVKGGLVVRAIPVKTGTDPKKLEAKLRALGLDPSVYMDVTLSFKVNHAKLEVLQRGGALTLDEVAYDPSFRVSVEREVEPRE